jgi:FlgN protein
MMAPFPTPHASMPAVQTYARPAAAPALSIVGASTDRQVPALVRPASAAALDALLDALRSERKLLDELVATMRRQRTAVGADDLQSVDDSVFATHRILATLGQARVRRRQINRILVGGEELQARDLDLVLGAQMTDALRTARDELQASAAVLSREVDVNRRVLRDALASGDAQARTLVGVGGPLGAPPAGGTLLNRTA